MHRRFVGNRSFNPNLSLVGCLFILLFQSGGLVDFFLREIAKALAFRRVRSQPQTTIA
jgi:hypothetical protein